MPRMVVLTDSETAVGFRLAGVEVRESDGDKARQDLDDLIQSDAYGLVVVDEGLVPDPIGASERAMRGRELPVVLPLPSLTGAFGESDDAVAYMKALVRNAIGFDIKLE